MILRRTGESNTLIKVENKQNIFDFKIIFNWFESIFFFFKLSQFYDKVSVLMNHSDNYSYRFCMCVCVREIDR
jgi:hypothetical protein